ncbi:hypothetical protein CBR_g4751 [Chara braunii]|uniref:Uncharacterized protein n=1 Tax=Chara braunii TaxID=69332 RepID=A0A388KIP3_CHABU|nr:hypothetical protein CBR_g4751 [Chara braunii]|eukprot:GBG69925.1 hypothetical protein CBR_g4751 [Chara braunii]
MAALVDYGSSSDSDDDGEEMERQVPAMSFGGGESMCPHRDPPLSADCLPSPSIQRLPDAVMLLGAPMSSICATSAMPPRHRAGSLGASTLSLPTTMTAMDSRNEAGTWPARSGSSASSTATMDCDDELAIDGGYGGYDGGAGRGRLSTIARKRTHNEANGSATSARTSLPKTPRGRLPITRVPPDTSDGRLVPPQLTGRSNVVTEDLDRIFVRRTCRPG